jgi:hypothetical protein
LWLKPWGGPWGRREIIPGDGTPIIIYDANREYNILRVIDEKEIKSKLYDGVLYGSKI